MTSNSPLEKYQRSPKLQIDLPSGGKWYPQGALEKAQELDVYSITASDEIRARTPDSLYNGHATVEIIRKNVPAIKNPWLMPYIDVDLVLSALRLATYGDQIEFESKCPECDESNSYAVTLTRLLDHFHAAQFIDEVAVDGFLFRLRPLTYKEELENNKINFRLQRQIIQQIPKIEDEDEKSKMVDKIYEEMYELFENTICSAVTEVVTPDGDSETTPQFIKQFLLGNDKKYFNKIKEVYENTKRNFAVPKTDVECAGCGHKHETTLILDYSNFFSQG